MNLVHNGYMGNILRINLTSGKMNIEPLPDGLVQQFVGGRGFGAKLLFDELKPGTDPFSPENKLIFKCGPLAETLAQSCSRWIVTTKSPLTGGIFRSSAGGGFGAELKSAGYDVLIVEGKADRPVYLWIQDEKIELRDAGSLVGRLSHETTESLRRDLQDSRIKVAAIGPGGEKMVRFAAIVDERRTASRGGVGAVMGSKNLKAIAVRGSKRPNIANREKLLTLTKKQGADVKTEPRFQGFRHLGTAVAVGFCHDLGIYPIKNFQEGVFPEVEGRLTGAEVEKIFVRDVYCRSCPVHCGSILKVKEGLYAGDEVEGPEYETLYSFGGEVGNSDLGMVIEANRICDDYGVDTMTAGATIGFAMECYEKGILTGNDLDGIDLTWGNHTAIIALLKKIVKREGIGDLLAEGSRYAARKIGKGSEVYAMQVKGLELAGYDPRGLKGLALNYATAAFGASHCVGQCPQEVMGTGPSHRFVVEGKGALCKMNQDKVASFETGIVCIFPMQFNLIDFKALAEMLYAVTGIEAFGSVDYIRQVGERIWNMERAFNVREGFSRKDDKLPDRFLRDALKEGPVQGQVVELDRLLDEYYDLRGWDRKTGFPTRQTLETLGLHRVADELASYGKLAPY